QHERISAGILEAMHRLDRNVRRLIRFQLEHVIAARDAGAAVDDDPMLAAPMMQLKRQRAGALHLDALDLEAGPFFELRIAAPGTRDGAMQLVRIVAARLQFADDILDAL